MRKSGFYTDLRIFFAETIRLKCEEEVFMEGIKRNRMAEEPVKKLIWKLGLPMIVSMVLQALYNVVDSIFVANIKDTGALANEALTIAFPVQIMIIAIGVGTGVGLNALLSKSLGEKNGEKVAAVAGNGIFLSLAIYLIFLLFGAFCSEWFISLFTDDPEVFAMGVSGAAWATIIGQFVSLFVAMALHYCKNKEICGYPKYIRPDFKIIRAIYSIGFSAALMQAFLSVMMAGMNAILGAANADSSVLVGAFGIYYKIQQIALFSAFGLSNTIITVLSFNYGMQDKERSKQCIRCGIADTLIVSLCITALFQIIAVPLSKLFSLSGGGTAALVDICAKATRIASLSFVFMGFNVAVQGVLQALGFAFKPLVSAFLRLILFTFPVAFLFTLSSNVLSLVWWTFPIAEILDCFVSFVFLKQAQKQKIEPLDEKH